MASLIMAIIDAIMRGQGPCATGGETVSLVKDDDDNYT